MRLRAQLLGASFQGMRTTLVPRSLNACASGFRLKRTSPEELIAWIHTVAFGDSLLSPSVTRRVIDRIAEQPGADRPYDERLGELTPA
jgi:DNA-binding NarL/FixJ family response regulator